MVARARERNDGAIWNRGDYLLLVILKAESRELYFWYQRGRRGRASWRGKDSGCHHLWHIYIYFLTSDIKDCISVKDEHSQPSLGKGHLDKHIHTRCYTHRHNVACQGENTRHWADIDDSNTETVHIRVCLKARCLLLLWAFLWWKRPADEEMHQQVQTYIEFRMMIWIWIKIPFIFIILYL